MFRRLAAVAVFLCVVLMVGGTPASAQAPGAARIEGPFLMVKNNPADLFTNQFIEPSLYQTATRCANVKRPGINLAAKWLAANASGEFWGSYRCEKWGKGQASLHAENRAIDWHLDARDPNSKQAGLKLIRTLLAPDANGNQAALARRMGIEEIIWDCSYWGAWNDHFTKYSYCYSQSGKVKKHYDPTTGHMDHLHLGFTKAGSNGQTSFWKWYRQHQTSR